MRRPRPHKDSVRLIKGDVWPLDDVSLRDIEEDLMILEQQRRLVRYEVDGRNYLAVVNWHEHQAINRKSKAEAPGAACGAGSVGPERSELLHRLRQTGSRQAQ
jgi:hypothetical protein